MLCLHKTPRVGAAPPAGPSSSSRCVALVDNLLEEQSDWASIAPELLLLIFQKVQERQHEAGEGRRIVSCAGVCRSWRRQVYQFCHSVCHMPYIQFPSSLSQPGPRTATAPVQCVLRRGMAGLITLYYGEQRDFMLSARRKWRPGGYSYVISSQQRRSPEKGEAFMGKLKANFWCSEFVLWDGKRKEDAWPLTGIYFSEDVIDGVRQRRLSCVLIPPGISNSCAEMALPFRLPRSLSSVQTALSRSFSKTVQASLARTVSRASSARMISPAISCSQAISPLPRKMLGARAGKLSLTACFSSGAVLEDEGELDGERMMHAQVRRRKVAKLECRAAARNQPTQRDPRLDSVVGLRSKIPEWDRNLQCWSLDFKGRASLPSVHNFQLLVDGCCGRERGVMEELRTEGVVVLQLGKIGKGLYTMDYTFPLTAVQAFAICISSFSTCVGLEP